MTNATNNPIFVLFLTFPGCCFVTFHKRAAALEAQNALHNVKMMPGVSCHSYIHFIMNDQCVLSKS